MDVEKIPTDILISICAEWLTVKDVVKLDTACCMRSKRSSLFTMYRHPGFFLREDVEGYNFTNWLKARRLRSSYLRFSSLDSFVEYVQLFSDDHYLLSSVSYLQIDHIHSSDTHAITAYISQSIHLQSLGLRGCTSSDAAASIIASLSPLCILQKLDLYDFHDYLNSNFSTHDKVLTNLSSLSILDLSFSNFASDGLWFTEPPLCPNLHTLLLNQCYPATRQFFLRIVVCYGRQLRKLEANFCEALDNIALNNIIDLCPNLEHLGIAGSNLCTAASIERLGESSFQLKALNIANHWFLSSQTLISIMRRMHAGGGNILDFNMSRVTSGADNSVLIHLAEHAADIQRLDLSYCFKISDAGLLSVAMCCVNLISINISYCPKITNLAVEQLIARCLSIEELHLVSCVEITDDLLIYIAGNNQTLKRLDVSGCPLLTDIGIWGLAAGLTRNTLQHFEISDNNHISLLSINHLIQQCQTLRRLNIIHCRNIQFQDLVELEKSFAYRLELLEMRGYSQIIQATEEINRQE